MQLSRSSQEFPIRQTSRENCDVYYDGELVVYDLSVELDEQKSAECETVSVYLNFSDMGNLTLIGVEPLPFCEQPTADPTFEDLVYKIQLRQRDNFRAKLQAVLHCRTQNGVPRRELCAIARYRVGQRAMRTVAY